MLFLKQMLSIPWTATVVEKTEAEVNFCIPMNMTKECDAHDMTSFLCVVGSFLTFRVHSFVFIVISTLTQRVIANISCHK